MILAEHAVFIGCYTFSRTTNYSHYRSSWRDDFTRFGGASCDRAVEWGVDLQIAAIGHRLLQLRAGATGFGLGGLYVGLRLPDLLLDGRGLCGANRRVVEVGFGGEGFGAAWGEEKALELLAEAGFSQVEVKRLPHDIINNYYIAGRN